MEEPEFKTVEKDCATGPVIVKVIVTGVVTTFKFNVPLLTTFTCNVLPVAGHIPSSGCGSPLVVNAVAATLTVCALELKVNTKINKTPNKSLSEKS